MINFDKGTTSIVAANLRQFWENNMTDFKALFLGTGQGKTAIAVKFVGLIADQKKHDMDLRVFAPKAVAETTSWQDTVNEYNKTHKYKVILNGGVKTRDYPKKFYTTKKKRQEAILKLLDDYILKILENDANARLRYLKLTPVKRMNAGYLTLDIFEKKSQLENDVKRLRKRLATAEKRRTVDEARSEFNEYSFFIADECQDYKNYSSGSGRAYALHKLTEGYLMLGLSGTTETNSELDNVGYLILAGLYKSRADFWRKNIEPFAFDENHSPIVDKVVNDENGKALVVPIKDNFVDYDRFRREVETVVFTPKVDKPSDMPDSETVEVEFKNDADANALMTDLIGQMKRGEFDSNSEFLARFNDVLYTSSARKRQLYKLLNQHKNHKILIFYNTNVQLDAIVEVLEHNKIPFEMLNGSNSAVTEMNGDGTEVRVLQYKAGGAGIEFKESDISIFYAPTYSGADFKQAKGRNIRRGQQVEGNTVTQYILRSTSRVEYRQNRIMLGKDNLADVKHSEMERELVKDLINELEDAV